MLRGARPARRASAACRCPRSTTPSARATSPRCSRPRARSLMAAPVRITFLGGLGEIGRNCACVEVDGRIMLLDCGLMFPDADMLGIDLVLPDFTYLRENADRIDGCIVTHGHEDHVGGLSFLLRELSFPIYGSRADPRPGPQPHRGGRPARPHRAHPGRRRRAPPDRPVRRASSSPSPTRCPTGSPPPSTRRRARSCTPATSSSTSPRSTAASPTWPASAPSPRTRASACCSSRLDQRRRAGPRPVARRRSGKVLYDLFHAARGPAHRHRLLRQPHPPRPADRRRRHRLRPRRSPPSACR